MFWIISWTLYFLNIILLLGENSTACKKNDGINENDDSDLSKYNRLQGKLLLGKWMWGAPATMPRCSW